ncbi:MAG: HNH endonuclease [Oscillospiraceae bacterium]|jgi:5-methylcytosine-specific restriction endonuclease McrA|nr:HNH endonuclease [Oscillospiraceae bacterium]
MIRKRDMYLCQVCLRQGVYNCGDIEVHHAIKIDEDKELTFDSSNLITLCQKHHRQADDGEITFEVIKKIIEEQEQTNEKNLKLFQMNSAVVGY